MDSERVYVEYDGQGTSIKNNQLDAKVLSSILKGFADLIYEATRTVNGEDAPVKVNAEAGFVKGSFGVEFIILQDLVLNVEVLKLLGLAGAPIAGGVASTVISVIQALRGRYADEIHVDESNGTIDVITPEGPVPASAEVIKLVNNPSVRKHLDKVLYEPLTYEGIDWVEVRPTSHADLPTVLKATKESSVYFKNPGAKKPSQSTEISTTAEVEFLTAKKEDGKQGWRAIHLGKEIRVCILDESFLAAIRRVDGPSPFGQKFKVSLRVQTKVVGEIEKTRYFVDKVISDF